MIRWITTLLTCLLIASLTGCGSTTKMATTRIDPATVALSDHFNEKLGGDSRATKLVITPPLTPQPAQAAMATAPSTVSVTQAPAPVTVKIDGREITAPAGSAVSVEIADVKSPPETTHDRRAEASGATLRTDDNKGNFDASAPKADLGNVSNSGIGGGGSSGGGGNATGGSTSTAWENIVAAVASASSRISFWLAGFGALCIIAAVVMLIAEHMLGGATDWPLVGLLVAAGVCCIGFAIVADTHPWVIVVLALLIVVGVVGYVLYWKFGKTPTVAAITAPLAADATALLAQIAAAMAPKAPAPTPSAGPVITNAPK